MLYSPKIREEELKNRVADDFFGKYNCNDIIKDIDFAVKTKLGEYLFWAEAKAAISDILVMLTQLVLTIGKARTFNKILPPKFLGCFDCEKIAFIPYFDIQDIFHQNDFNWNVAPSNRETKEFKQIYEKIKQILTGERTCIFKFSDEKSLKLFILKNFLIGKNDVSKIKIDKNNFISIYAKWLEAVKPTIAINWDAAKKKGIFSGHFYIADLISDQNSSLKENLMVVLRVTCYEMNRHKDEFGAFSSSEVSFNDKQRAHTAFWAIYERPPKEDYWDYIIERQDLLVPQDVRERKGSFFTPQIWVELSQKYIADALGEDWQDEYYVWDCAAGTGNLLAGLTNKYNIWASTLDKADVDVMHDRIDNGANLLKEHCFQFDFLNDDFDKLPQGLRKIIDDPKKRKKLVIYINPPYAEATSYGIRSKAGVSSTHKTYQKYKDLVGIGINEIFVQFFVQIINLIPDCKLASFGTLKYVISQNFVKFRDFFKADFKKGFICCSNSFDNVKGKFPIGFLFWDLENKKRISKIRVDVYDNDKEVKQSIFIGTKKFFPVEKGKLIIDWLRKYFDKKTENIGYLRIQGTDFQTNNTISISSQPTANDIRESKTTEITSNNLIECCIYFSVRHCIPATWLNDRDQFLYPNNGWETDLEFQSDCLVYTLFHGQNNISSKYGINHWIPFIEWDVGAHDKFDSHFMTDFIAGKIEMMLREPSIFYNASSSGGGIGRVPYKEKKELKFSKTAKNVFKAGRELWKYYHAQPKCNVNASLYDIREHFQGRNANGKMNNKSDDKKYNELLGDLRFELKELAREIEPKVYEYGFLKA